MNTSLRSIATRIGLASALVLGTAGAAWAEDLSPQATMQISVGTSQEAVRSQFGEPIKETSYLFAPGKAWFYYVKGGTLGNEKLVRVNFDSQGVVQSAKLVDAGFYELNRYE